MKIDLKIDMKLNYLLIGLLCCFYFIACSTNTEQAGIKQNKKRESITKVEIAQSTIVVPDLELGKISSTEFRLKNTGDFPLIISNVKSTCGCTVPSWDKNPIEPGGETRIKVQIKPQKAGFFQKRVSIFGNLEDYYISVVIKGNVK